jgi:hypothetical protein
MADTALQKPGIIFVNDYRLVALTLLTAAGTLDIKNVLVELVYNEDLFNNSTSGYIAITDSSGFIEKFNMNGNEYLRMIIGKADDTTNAIDKLFRVYKVAKRKPEGSGLTEVYCLYFCSEELLLSEQYKINKSFPATDIATIVDTILTVYLNIDASNRTSGDIEPTYGVYDFIIPNLKPFDAINWLCTYARPMPPNVGADMLFYEDKQGFKLRSLQTLYSSPVYETYSYSTKNSPSPNTNESDLTHFMRTAATYEIIDSYDALSAINSGVFANQILNVDILTRNHFTKNFDYWTYAGQSLNDYKITNYFTNRLGESLNQTSKANYKLVFGNPNQQSYNAVASKPGSVAHDIFAEVYIPNRTAQLPLSNYTRVKISVPGDPGLTVGRTINFNLLSKDPNNKELDPFYSGKYIITATRHQITGQAYTTVMEITKESTTVQYSQMDNSSTLWKNTVAGKKVK